jgi:threonine-phosphate decarboxylase
MMLQSHGADIYRRDGSRAKLIDFSSTVVEVPPPMGWQARLGRELKGLRHYPQPYATGLAAHIEKALRLAPGSVMACNGSSEALGWIAQSLRGKRVVLEAPCFGDYAVWLGRYGARVREIGADEPWSPEWPRLAEAVEAAQSFWTANPANPSGLEMTLAEFKERLDFCRDRGILLVLDEALLAQSLKFKGEQLLRLCLSRPGALVVRSLSKGLGLPGLRLGYVAGHPAEIAKLGRFQDPWTVSSLAQSAGPWIFDQERRHGATRLDTLIAWKADLLGRLGKIPAHSLLIRQSDTGFFLCRLLGRMDDSRRLASRLAAQGILLRSCASYGGWGTGYVRLNPRSPLENARLERALKKIYEAL